MQLKNHHQTTSEFMLANNTHRFGNSILLTSLLITALFCIPLLADQIVTDYDVPEYSSGLAWDGNLVWMGGVGPAGEWIRGFDVNSGNLIDSIRAPIPDCIGLAWFQNRLVYLSPRSDTTYFVSREGFEVAFCNPIKQMAGLGVDDETLWSSTYSERNGIIMQLNENGELLRSMPFSCRHSRDCAFHRGRVYVADRLTQQIRVVNPEDGLLIRTFQTPQVNPNGLTSDGNFLWLLDDGDNKGGDKLYQILISPDGNIRLSSLAHNFGSVVITDLTMWDLWVYNDGVRTATLERFENRNGNADILMAHDHVFPRQIAGGDSARLRFSFSPAYEDSVHIEYGLTYDVDRQTYWVDLRGKGVRRERNIRITQRVLDFGMTRCGELVRGSNLRYLLVENYGGESLTIEELRFSNESFFHGYYNFPHTFERPGLYRVPIFFRPNRGVDTTFHESVTVFSNDPDSPEIRVNLEGMTRLNNYNGGHVLWVTNVGNREAVVPLVRAIQCIDDVTGDGLADVVIASNDFQVRAYHAASTQFAIPVWTYRTNANPWRNGMVASPRGLSEGDDWDNDGVHDIVFGLEGGAKQIISLSGRTGEEIWIFDTHCMQDGGGDVLVTGGEVDFTNDNVNDVYAAVAASNLQNATNAIIMLNGQDGTVVWSTDLEEPPLNCYAVDDFTGDDVEDLFVLLESGNVLGMDGLRGRIVWNNNVEGHIRSMFPMRGDVNGDGSIDLAFVAFEAGVTVFNGSNGIQLWNNRTFDDLRAGIPMNDLNGNGSPDIVYGDDIVARSIDGLTGTAAWDSSVYIGAEVTAMAPMMDFDHDRRMDYIVGTPSGRLYAHSGDGAHGLWSYSNQGEGHAFVLIECTRDIDGNGEMDVFAAMANGTVYCFAGSYVGIDPGDVPIEPENRLIPEMLIVDPAYPNPFNSSVIIPVRLRVPSKVDLRVINILGREVYQRSSLHLSTGTHRLVWDGSTSSGIPLPSGMYFMEVKSISNRVLRQVELLK